MKKSFSKLFLSLLFIGFNISVFYSCQKEEITESNDNNEIQNIDNQVMMKVSTTVNGRSDIILSKSNSNSLECHYDIANKNDDVYNFNFDYNSFPDIEYLVVESNYLEWIVEGRKYYAELKSENNTITFNIFDDENNTSSMVIESTNIETCDIIDFINSNNNIVSLGNVNKMSFETNLEPITISLICVGIAAAVTIGVAMWDRNCAANVENARSCCRAKGDRYVFRQTTCGGTCTNEVYGFTVCD